MRLYLIKILGSLLSVGWTFGLVMSYSLGSILDWNWLALSACSVPAAQFVVLAASEPSPRWLVSKGQVNEAKKALAYFRGCSEFKLVKHVECELKDMEHQVLVITKYITYIFNLLIIYNII